MLIRSCKTPLMLLGLLGLMDECNREILHGNRRASLRINPQLVGPGRTVAGPDLKAGKLVQLFETYRIPDHTFFTVFLEREYMPAKVRAFLDFAIEYIGGNQPY